MRPFVSVFAITLSDGVITLIPEVEVAFGYLFSGVADNGDTLSATRDDLFDVFDPRWFIELVFVCDLTGEAVLNFGAETPDLFAGADETTAPLF